MKQTRFAKNLFILINLILTLLYVSCVDSLSNYYVISYAILLTGMWWVVRLLHKKEQEEKENM